MNPFKYGEVVQDDNFCRRPELEKDLISNIRSGQNLVVQGDRRIGKTSLIHAVITNNFKTYLMIDLRGVKDEEDFLNRFQLAINRIEKNRILKAIKKIEMLKGSISVGPLKLEFNNPSVSGKQSVQSFFDLTKAMAGKQKCVVFFDEFQDIMNLDKHESIIGAMRAEIQHMGKFPFIFAGSARNEMYRIFMSPSSAFYKGAKLFDIGPVEKENFIPFLNEKFLINRIKPTREFWDEVFRITTVSGDIQQLCSAVWDVTKKKTTLKAEDVHKGLERIYASEGRAHEYLFNRLTALQLRVLTTLARNPELSPTTQKFIELSQANNGPSILRVIESATKFDIIFKSGRGKYEFVSPFFREWLKSRLG